MQNPLPNQLIKIKNASLAAKREVYLRPASNLLMEILKILQMNNYIGTFEYIEDGRDGTFKVELIGKINEIKAIVPRFSCGKNDFEKYEKRFLPSKDIGLLIVSTPEGVMTHREAKMKGIGGKLLAYVY
jgi:small subunit ribosomal protein S8